MTPGQRCDRWTPLIIPEAGSNHSGGQAVQLLVTAEGTLLYSTLWSGVPEEIMG